MWRRLRREGWQITSSWIYEAGEGETADFEELWLRIEREISHSDALLLYAENGDFPLKGALVEVGIALGMGKPVLICVPDVKLAGRSMRPIGSWIAHPLVNRIPSLGDAPQNTDMLIARFPGLQSLPPKEQG